MKNIVVCGAGGFIGHHLVNKLKEEGSWVRGVDLKYPEFSDTSADDFLIGDLRNLSTCLQILGDRNIDEIYQLAADMGGAGFVFTGENDSDIAHNSAQINLNMLEACRMTKTKRIFYSSSACVYPEYNQEDPNNPDCSESSVYPAAPDSEYGWEKLFSERLYMMYRRNYGIESRIARYHNIYGPECSWNDGREKSPAAMCRKVAEAGNSDFIEVWGDGEQTRSFLHVKDCIEATIQLTRSMFNRPINIGSEEMVTINKLVSITSKIADKTIHINHVEGPLGVRGRNSDNRLIEEILNWIPKISLEEGMKDTYSWIEKQVGK